MFKYIFLLIATLGSVALAEVNTYAPTLKSVILIRDSVEVTILPRFFHSIMGEVLDMQTDPSCEKVRVQDKFIYCVSTQGRAVFVGLVDSTRGFNQGWEMINVKWVDTAEIAETKDVKSGGLSYSVRVK